MRLDKQKFNFNLTSTGENIIRCSQVDEAFFNVFNIVLNEDVAFIKPAERYIDDHPIIKIDVEYGNKLYENIEFKVVVDATSKSQVFINEHALIHGEQVEFESESLLQEQIVQVEELIEEPIELEHTQDWHNLEEQARVNKESKIATFLLQMEQQLLERIDESIAQARQSIATSALGIQNKAELTIQQKVKESSNEFARLFEQWKQSTEIKINGCTIDMLKKACKHLEDQFEVVVQEQEESTFSHLSEKIFAASIETKNALHGEITSRVQELTESLQTAIKDADESLRLHVEQQLQQFNDNIVAESIKNFDDGIAAFFNKQTLWLQEASAEQINQIKESAVLQIESTRKTIDEAIESLQGKHGELAQQLKEHAQQTLEQAADKITTEQIKSVRECVDEVLAEQMHALEAKASDEQIISEARAAQANVFKNALGAIKTEMSNEVKSHVANLQSDLYKKFAIYAQSYAGGGTVAAQFADGGTMNGTLNVATGQILSAGNDLFNIFATSTNNYLSALYDVDIPAPVNGQVLTYSSSINKWTAGSALSASGEVGYYGSFYDDTPVQSDGSSTAFKIKLGKTFESNGISLSSDSIVFNHAGAYEITFSVLLANSGNDVEDVSVWFRKNNVDIPDSNSIFSVSQKRTSNIPSKLVGTVPIIVSLSAGENISFYWHSSNSASTHIITIPAGTNPTTPATPGIIVTAKQITLIQNTGGSVSGDYLPLSGGTVTGNVVVQGTLTTSLLEATSANITYIDVKQYELSGFDVTGNVAITGSLSASGIVYGSSSNSNAWSSAYTTVLANSGAWGTGTGSGIDTGVRALTANWQNTYSTVSTTSSSWLQTISFNENTALLSITNGNSISLSALSSSSGIAGNFLPLSGGSLTGPLSTNQDIEITDSTKGIILRSPGNFKYRVTVTDAGELVTTLV